MSNEYHQKLKIRNLENAIIEARRFIEKAKAAKNKLAQDEYFIFGFKETAAAKRASMDLTRSLAELRK